MPVTLVVCLLACHEAPPAPDLATRGALPKAGPIRGGLDGRAGPRPGKRSAGEPCERHDECADRLCAAVAAIGRVCTRACDDGACPLGLTCLATDDGPLCVEDGVMNCQPCQADGDCNQAGLSGYACVSRAAEGDFCASACSTEAACPRGYTCTDGRCRSGAPCTCNAVGIALGAETSCLDGDQPGMRGCGAAGLSPCRAARGPLSRHP